MLMNGKSCLIPLLYQYTFVLQGYGMKFTFKNEVSKFIFAGEIGTLGSASSLVFELTGSIPGSGTFFHELSVACERWNSEF